MRPSALPLVAATLAACGPHLPAGSAAQGVCALPAVASPPPEAGACLGARLLAGLGTGRLLVGLSGDDTAAAGAPYDLRYQYLAGGLPDGPGPCASCATGCSSGGVSCANASGGCGRWGCWQWDQRPPGQFPADFVAGARARGQIPMITYYLVLPATHVAEGTAEATQAATDGAFMARYLADWRFALQRIGSEKAFLHIEPDFWGYAQHAAIGAGAGPETMPAAVSAANPTDCAGGGDTLAGLGRCMIGMVRKYAPNAGVGSHASGCALPDFHQAFTWAKNVAEVGNIAQANAVDHRQGNRVDYLFGHPDEVTAAHGMGLAFGAGAAGQTTPSTGGGNLATRVQAYRAGGGQPLCP